MGRARMGALMVVLVLVLLLLASCEPSEGLNLACGAPIFGLVVVGAGLARRREL